MTKHVSRLCSNFKTSKKNQKSKHRIISDIYIIYTIVIIAIVLTSDACGFGAVFVHVYKGLMFDVTNFQLTRSRCTNVREIGTRREHLGTAQLSKTILMSFTEVNTDVKFSKLIYTRDVYCRDIRAYI